MRQPLFDSGSTTRALLDAIPSMVFVVNEDVVVLHANRAAARALGENSEIVLKRLCGEVLKCLHSDGETPGTDPGVCGTTEACKTCVLRTSTAAAFASQSARRQRYTMRLQVGQEDREVHFLVTASAFEHETRRLGLLILEDVTELVDLRRVISLCAWCKRVKNDDEYQDDVETYLRKHSPLTFNHAMCPECFARLYPGQDGP